MSVDCTWKSVRAAAVMVIVRTLDRDLYYRFVDGWASDANEVDGVLERLGEGVRA